MKIYNVIHVDRHYDPTATPFIDKEEAIDYAKNIARHESFKYPEEFTEENIAGWVYYVKYSCEGDCLYVTEHEIEEK